MKAIVYEALSYGKASAIKSKDLVRLLGFRTIRDLQKQVETERAAGFVILSDACGAGYYRSNDPEELRRFTRTLIARAKNTAAAAKSAQIALDNATGQQSVAGWYE